MESLKEKVKGLEKEEIINALKECNGVMSRAARKLGITERMIGYKVKKYNIRKEEVIQSSHLGSFIEKSNRGF
jgi:transcriptional regulator with GAF, ATPase, and Fis domain